MTDTGKSHDIIRAINMSLKPHPWKLTDISILLKWKRTKNSFSPVCWKDSEQLSFQRKVFVPSSIRKCNTYNFRIACMLYMRHSTPAAALMSETCFGHNHTRDLKLTALSLEQLRLSPAVNLLRSSPVWGALCRVRTLCGLLVAHVQVGPTKVQIWLTCLQMDVTSSGRDVWRHVYVDVMFPNSTFLNWACKRQVMSQRISSSNTSVRFFLFCFAFFFVGTWSFKFPTALFSKLILAKVHKTFFFCLCNGGKDLQTPPPQTIVGTVSLPPTKKPFCCEKRTPRGITCQSLSRYPLKFCHVTCDVMPT